MPLARDRPRRGKALRPVYTLVLFSLLLMLVPCRAACDEAYLHLRAGGGMVMVDGDTINPASPIVLDAGLHRMTYLPTQGEGLWKTPLLSLAIHLDREETLHVDLESTIDIRVVSNPPGCDVYRGPTRIGRTPFVMSTLEGYPDTLTLVKDRHITTRISPEHLTDGETYHVTMLTDGSTVTGLHNGETRGRSRLGSFLKYGSLGASITAMSLGFWYKDRADQYYEEYLSRGDPETLDRLYRKSIEYDDRARVYWIVGEAAVILTSYFFLRDILSSPAKKPNEIQDWSYYE